MPYLSEALDINLPSNHVYGCNTFLWWNVTLLCNQAHMMSMWSYLAVHVYTPMTYTLVCMELLVKSLSCILSLSVCFHCIFVCCNRRVWSCLWSHFTSLSCILSQSVCFHHIFVCCSRRVWSCLWSHCHVSYPSVCCHCIFVCCIIADVYETACEATVVYLIPVCVATVFLYVVYSRRV